MDTLDQLFGNARALHLSAEEKQECYEQISSVLQTDSVRNEEAKRPTEQMNNDTDAFLGRARAVQLPTAEKRALFEEIEEVTGMYEVDVQQSITSNIARGWQNVLHGLSLPALACIALCAVGSSVAFAAEGALPGEFLYGVKVHINEPVRAAVALSSKARAEWHITRAERRLQEAEVLSAAGLQTSETRKTVERLFAQHVHQAQQALDKDDPAQAKHTARIGAAYEGMLAAHEKLITTALQTRKEDPVRDTLLLAVQEARERAKHTREKAEVVLEDEEEIVLKESASQAIREVAQSIQQAPRIKPYIPRVAFDTNGKPLDYTMEMQNGVMIIRYLSGEEEDNVQVEQGVGARDNNQDAPAIAYDDQRVAQDRLHQVRKEEREIMKESCYTIGGCDNKDSKREEKEEAGPKYITVSSLSSVPTRRVEPSSIAQRVNDPIASNTQSSSQQAVSSARSKPAVQAVAAEKSLQVAAAIQPVAASPSVVRTLSEEANVLVIQAEDSLLQAEEEFSQGNYARALTQAGVVQRSLTEAQVLIETEEVQANQLFQSHDKRMKELSKRYATLIEYVSNPNDKAMLPLHRKKLNTEFQKFALLFRKKKYDQVLMQGKIVDRLMKTIEAALNRTNRY